MTTPKQALELKGCPFCGATPHRGLGKVYHDQLHGEPHQDFSIWCPKGHAKVTGVNAALAADEWNTRATPSLQGEDAVERVALAFHPGEQAPDVKRGSMECCIVVTENEQGKHFAFPGYYLNAYPLQYDECRCDEPCEDGCPTTGWFYDESNFEYENCYYPISSKILRWALIPDAECILATGLVPDEAAVRADEREKQRERDAETADCMADEYDATSFTSTNAEQVAALHSKEQAAHEIAAAIRSNGRGA